MTRHTSHRDSNEYANGYRFQAIQQNLLISLAPALSGTCSAGYNRSLGEGNVILAPSGANATQTWTIAVPPPPPPIGVTLALDNVTHEISPLTLGCHSDTGYSHQARGLYSQMIVGSSFNSTNYSDGRWNVSCHEGVVPRVLNINTCSHCQLKSPLFFSSPRGR